LLGMPEHGKSMIASSGSSDERRPAFVLFDHWAVVGPRAGIGQRPLAVDNSRDACADGGVVSVGANDLPRRTVMETDKHFVVVGVGSQFLRECFIDASPAGVRVDGCPDRFAALQKFRQAVPVISYALECGDSSVMQTHFV